MFAAERRDLAAACARLAAEGLAPGASGNASVRAGGRFVVTPAGRALVGLEPGDMVVIDEGGSAVEGTGRPTSETPLHLALYERFGAGAVVHTHGPFATALSCVLDEVPPVHYGMALVGGPIKVAAYATYGTPELADAVAAALEGRTAALMRNHGAVAVGRDLPQAVETAVFTEWVCRVWWTAKAVGEPSTLTAAQLEDVVRRNAAG